MRKSIAISKLEKNGYKLISCMEGGYIAKKNNISITASSINGLITKIFK